MRLFAKVTSSLIRLLLLYDDYGKTLTHTIAKTISNYSKNYCHFKLRPKKASSFKSTRIKTTTPKGQLAIIIQGLPEYRDDFTLETVRLYKAIFPGAHIIISTWDTVDDEILSEYIKEECHIVISKSFNECGFGNVNYQICTTFNGLLKAKELGATFSLKCRSDLRIYKEFAFEYLKSLLELIPIDDHQLGTNGRIITLSAGQGQMFYPNWLQDYLYFGYTDDLIDLFDIPYSNRHIHSSGNYLKKEYHPCTAEDMCREEVPEVYITKRFLEKHIQVKDSVEAWWQLLGRYFIILGDDDLNSFWNKYDHFSLNIRNCEYDNCCSFEDKKRNISFTTFLAIKDGRIKYERWMENCRRNLVLFE